ncbi:MAG: hypothetical protein AB1505_11730 [Candidatus Latescibacterota bacterium]
MGWTCAKELGSTRQVVSGSDEALVGAIARGADLQVGTRFRHNEHIDTASTNREPIAETMAFRVTYVVDGRWAAGVCTLRQPVSLPDAFGRPSMSFFLYNQDGQQAVARPYLDGQPATGAPGPSPLEDLSAMPKYHQLDRWDGQTSAPSQNFVYDFEVFRLLVDDRWRQVLQHDQAGIALAGSVEDLVTAVERGLEVKVAVADLCGDLCPPGQSPLPHEVIAPTVARYCYTEQGLVVAATEPLVRVQPGMPLRYASRGWDFGWLIARSDGLVVSRLYDPYTLQARDTRSRHAVRWLVG